MTKNETARAGGTAHGGRNGNNGNRYSHTSIGRTEPQEPRPVHSADGKKVIGVTIGETFHKHVRGSKHMLREPRGWAVDAHVPNELHARNVSRIVVTDTEADTVYTVTLAKFERYAVPINRGYGPQIVLPLGYWSINGKPPRLGQPSQPDPNAPRQLSLFDFDEVGA